MSSSRGHNGNWWIRYWERKSRLRANFASALASKPPITSDDKKRRSHPQAA